MTREPRPGASLREYELQWPMVRSVPTPPPLPNPNQLLWPQVQAVMDKADADIKAILGVT